MATIYVCRECKHSRGLQKTLSRETDATVKLVGCQDICRQPVAGARVDGRLEWFGGLDAAKRQRALIRLVNEPPKKVPDDLAKARVAKRAGKGPR